MKILTLFYSNYSGNCRALLQYLKTVDTMPIKFVNIDNAELKKAVERKFMSVPALVVLEDENVSLYTGENVFEWFSSQISVEQQEEAKKSVHLQSEPSKELSVENVVTKTATKTATELAAEISKDREKLV